MAGFRMIYYLYINMFYLYDYISVDPSANQSVNFPVTQHKPAHREPNVCAKSHPF